jgi:hypothetical protein
MSNPGAPDIDEAALTVGEAQLSTPAASVGAGVGGAGVGGAGVGGAGVGGAGVGGAGVGGAGVGGVEARGLGVGFFDVSSPPCARDELLALEVPDESSFRHPCITPAIRKIPKNVAHTLIGESIRK